MTTATLWQESYNVGTEQATHYFHLRDRIGRVIWDLEYSGPEVAYVSLLVALQKLQDDGWKVESISARDRYIAVLSR